MTTALTSQRHSGGSQASLSIPQVALGFGWFAVGVIGLVVAYATLGSDETLSTNPRFWPVMCALIMAGAGLTIGFQNVLSMRKKASSTQAGDIAEAGESHDTALPEDSVVRRWGHIWLFAAMFSYVLILPETGYVLTTFVFLVASLWLVGFHSRWKVPLIALVLTTGTAYLFGNLLGVALPRGSGLLRSLDGIFF